MRARGRRELDLAHELRTPITSLILAAGALSGERLSAKQRELVETLAREALRLKLLVDQALSTARLGAHAGPVDRASLDLAALVARAMAPLRAQAAAQGVEIQERLSGPARVVGDAAKLAWVATSLVGNALRFTPRGARVRVDVQARGDVALLRVGDAGPGVAASRRPALFARETGGTLFLVREIIDAHAGAVRVRSRAGQGATFTVALPAVPEITGRGW